MECYLADGAGKEFKLPDLLEWSFSYGCGKPCDCFEISLLYDESLLPLLDTAARFRAVKDGKTVFAGIVDEAETESTGLGALAHVRGRGMQALLLDNEVSAAQYFALSMEQMLEKYVAPFGVRNIKRENAASVALSISSGESAWRVLEDFMCFGGGGAPRFLPDGTLLLGSAEGRRLKIGAGTAVSRVSFKRKRYGVISEVLVKNKAMGSESRVLNEEFLARGGCCRRIVNVPRSTRFDAMRSTGEYQIRASKERERVISLTLCEEFAAFPGDIVELSGHKGAPEGAYFVGESRCFGGADGAGTEIVLTGRAE